MPPVSAPMPGRPGGGMVGQKAHDFKPSARRVLGLLRPERGRALVVILLAAVAAALNALGPKVRVFSQAEIVAESLAHYLARHPAMAEGGQARMRTTGDPARVSARATQFLRRPLAFEAA